MMRLIRGCLLKADKKIMPLILLAVAFLIESLCSNYTYFEIKKSESNMPAEFFFAEIDTENIAVKESSEETCIALKLPENGLRIVNLDISYKELTGAPTRYSVVSVVRGVAHSFTQYPEKWANINKNTRINLNSPDVCYEAVIFGEDLNNIKSITVNATNFNFNIFRFAVLAVLFAVVCLLHFAWSVENYNKSLIYMAALLFAYVTFVYACQECGLSNVLRDYEDGEAYIGAYEELTDSFANGSYNFVNFKPDEKMNAMEDPYDPTLRRYYGVDYPFDDSYYDGNFNTYFGVAPVFEIMLPYLWMTGKLLSTETATMIYFIIFPFALAFAYKRVHRELDIKSSLATYLLGYVLVIVVSGIGQEIMGWNGKYQIAVVSAIVHTLAAIGLAIEVGRKRGALKLALAAALGLAMGLMVLSKPSFIVYYVPILFILYKREYLAERNVRIFASFLVPLLLCAAFQMHYNYARYGSILEFGQRWQVGSCARLYDDFSLIKIIKELTLVFATPPKFTPNTFPFLGLQNSSSGIGWNTWHISGKILGILYIPLFYIMLFQRRYIKGAEVRIKRIFVLFECAAFASIMIPINIGAVNDGYLIDVRMALAFLSMIVWNHCLSAAREDDWKDIRNVFIVAAALSMIIMIPCGLADHFNPLLENFNSFNVELKNIFEFWG